MGSYEIIVKTEEIRRKVQEEDYFSALKVLETMDMKKVKNPSDLNLMAEVFSQNGRYDEAMELLNKIYHKSKTRKVLYQMVWASIKNNNIDDSERYLREYEVLAPKDFYKYIFQYQIDKLKGESYEVLIETLKTLKETEYIEQWAYELAKLYYKAGMEEECIAECSDIILWFGEGSYVEKAKVLKAYYSGEADKDMIIEELKKRAAKGKVEDQYREAMSQKTSDDTYDNQGTTEESFNTGIAEEDITVDFNSYEPSDDLVNSMKKEVEDILIEDLMADEEIKEADADTEINAETGLELEAEVEDDAAADTEAEDEAEDEAEAEYAETDADLEDDFVIALEEDFVATSVADAVTDFVADAVDNSDNSDSVSVGASITNLEVTSETAMLVNAETEIPTGKESSLDKDKPLSERDMAEQEVEEELYRLLEEEDEDSRKLIQLSEDYNINLMEIFYGFLQVKAVKKQLVKSIEQILDKNTKSVQMIITGTSGSGKTTLAKDIATFLNAVGKLKSPKVAKISAENLNAIDVFTKKDSLKDCCLVIENASELKAPTINKVLDLIKYYHGDIAVVFEENKKNMNRLFRECPKLMDLFKNRVHLPLYTEEELLGFAYSYIKMNEYRLLQGSEATLKTVVHQIIKSAEPNKRLSLIHDKVQAAMTSADVRTGKLLPSLAAQGRLGDVEVLSIIPTDFEV